MSRRNNHVPIPFNPIPHPPMPQYLPQPEKVDETSKPTHSEKKLSSFLSNEPTITIPFKYTWNNDPVLSFFNAKTAESTLFGPKNFEMIRFQLLLNINSFGFDPLCLFLISNEVPSLSLKYKLKLSDNTTIESKNDEYATVLIGKPFNFDLKHLNRSFGSNSNLLPIQCEFELKIPYKPNPEFSKLTSELNSLRLNSRFVDVNFVVGVKEFAANKIILSARSPVFSVMFAQTQFVENRENRVQITDIDAPTFEALLDFIYTSEVKQLDQIAPSLVIAAHKYDIKSLVDVCAQNMLKNITTQNVVYFLMLAKMYSLIELKDKAIDLINRNAQIVTNSEDFIKHVKPDNSLMQELYLDFVKKHPQA